MKTGYYVKHIDTPLYMESADDLYKELLNRGFEENLECAENRQAVIVKYGKGWAAMVVSKISQAAEMYPTHVR